GLLGHVAEPGVVVVDHLGRGRVLGLGGVFGEAGRGAAGADGRGHLAEGSAGAWLRSSAARSSRSLCRRSQRTARSRMGCATCSLSSFSGAGIRTPPSAVFSKTASTARVCRGTCRFKLEPNR